MGKGTCSVEGCERAAICRGWCAKHYQRWGKHGHPVTLAPVPATEERFWAKVARNVPNGCWEWTGSRTTGTGGVTIPPMYKRSL